MSYLTIKGLKSNGDFADLVQKLYLADKSNDSSLSETEITYLLSSAIILLRAYDLDHAYKSYAEFAYALILKISLLTKNFDSLYDFSVNFGFYPIASALARSDLIELSSLTDELSRRHIDKSFRHKNVVETFDQKKMRQIASEDKDAVELCLVAPTSYGKSTLIVEDISANKLGILKTAIIVPTKSLLAQTYKMLKREFPDDKIILHDEMYMNEQRFMAVLTQERALRLLLGNADLSFDKMYIDEAHNLFNKDSRVITLARLIKLNRKRNTDSKIMYLSPLISNSDNLKYDINQDIVEQRIDFNVKEPTYYNFSLNGEATLYNRFLDVFYPLGTKQHTFLEYVFENSGKKNFIYLYSPKRIEQFAAELSNGLEKIEDDEIEKVIDNLAHHVHEDFYAINYLRKGVVYLHGRLPDNIKDYLEYKFANLANIKYMVANRVVLEGINLPIDTLFVLNVYKLDNKNLTNLVGRVNRLNQIFSDPVDLGLLQPQIHFVNTEKYGRKHSNMQRAIRLLRTGLDNDKIENPLLYEFDINIYDTNKEQSKILAAEKILAEEEAFTGEVNTDVEKLKRSMVEAGLGALYDLSPLFCETIFTRLSASSPSTNAMDAVYNIFIKDLGEFIIDNEFKRLESEGTREYYSRFITENRNQAFKQSINKQVASFIARVQDPLRDSLVYFGEKLGERPSANGTRDLYVDLSVKTKPQLVNLAIAKLKIENDFINYKLVMVLQVLLDYKVINTDTYNMVVYGTNDKSKLNLIRLGLSLGIINKLENDEQLTNLTVDETNRIIANSAFNKYIDNLDDLTAYEIGKVL